MGTIKAKDFIKDLRSAVDDTALMSKYGLSHEGLQKVFEKNSSRLTS